MLKKKRLKEYIKEIDFCYIIYEKLISFYFKHFITDKGAIKRQYKKRLNRYPEYDNPVLFTDKLQWLKLNWYDQRAVEMADKYKVRTIVSDTIGEKYLNKIYGAYNSVDEIDISKLPKSFVLKGTHGSGFNIICQDKNKMNWKQELERMSKWLKQDYFWMKREWVYKDIKPKIICERYLSDKERNSSSLVDYKFYCFNGKPHFCQVIRDRGTGETIDFFNMEWEHMPFVGMRLLPNSKDKIKMPEKFDEMIFLSKKLSKGFPFVRVDFYYVNNRIYFGEMTFFPTSGMGKFDPPEWDHKLGDLLTLPK